MHRFGYRSVAVCSKSALADSLFERPGAVIIEVR